MQRAHLAILVVLGSAAPALGQTSSPEPEASVSTSPAAMDNVVSAFGVFSYWHAQTGLGLGARY